MNSGGSNDLNRIRTDVRKDEYSSFNVNIVEATTMHTTSACREKLHFATGLKRKVNGHWNEFWWF